VIQDAGKLAAFAELQASDPRWSLLPRPFFQISRIPETGTSGLATVVLAQA